MKADGASVARARSNRDASDEAVRAVVERFVGVEVVDPRARACAMND